MSLSPATAAAAEVFPGVFRWSAFSPEHKVELTSHAVRTDRELTLFDPIPLAGDLPFLADLRPEAAAIVLTNGNHERAAADWAGRFGLEIWAHAEADLTLEQWRRFEPGAESWRGWRLHPLPGGGPGEIALRRPELSLVVLGDAVFNLPDSGFGILPEKYCRDQPRLRTGLRGLVTEPFARALLAHGEPLREEAARRIGELL